MIAILIRCNVLKWIKPGTQGSKNDFNHIIVQGNTRKQRRKAREERHSPKSVQGAGRPRVVYLYFTSCHSDTKGEYISSTIFPMWKLKWLNYYSSFTVALRGKDINPDAFLEFDVFPNNVKVLLNRNKYKGKQNVWRCKSGGQTTKHYQNWAYQCTVSPRTLCRNWINN